MALLDTAKVVKRFGGLVAVNKMDFCIEKGEIVSIIGPNGAGKTTFFNTLTGIYRPEEGQISFNGRSLLGLRPDQIAERGIARTFQNIRLFASLSVIENVLVGMHIHLRQSPVQILTKVPAFTNEELAAEKKAEGRYVDLATVTPSPHAKAVALQCDKDPRLIEVILSESTIVMRVRPGLIITRHRLGLHSSQSLCFTCLRRIV